MQEPPINLDLIHKLDQLCLQYSGYQEGNLCYRGGSDPGTLEPAFLGKRQLWSQLCTNYTQCIEVGVNAGHSAVIALESNPNLSYTGIDACIHRYVKPCAALIAQCYPHRFRLLAGGSSLWLPVVEHPGVATIISIDGEHTVNQLRQDITHAQDLAQSGDIIWIDDMDNLELCALVRSSFPTVALLCDVAIISV